MSKPATEARLAAAANGFTQVIGRGNAHIITKNPSTGKCAYDGQVGGGWHYGADLETDTTLEQDADQNYWKMVKALYHIKVRKSFQAGDLVRWTDPTTGQYVILQPNNLSWVDNVTESQQFISSPAAVTGVVTDDVALWTNGYGAGRHFRYQAGPLRLTKHLIIDAAANLPAATVSNPYLEIAFVMTPGSGVSLIVDGTAWDKKRRKSTANAIEFRTSGGVTLWSFAAPKAYDSFGNEVAGIMQLRKQGANYIAAVRFPKSFFDVAAVGDGQGNSYYPVFLDPSVDYQVGASGDDGTWRGSVSFSNSGTSLTFGIQTQIHYAFARFPDVVIPDGATIDNAYLSFYYWTKFGTLSTCRFKFVDEADPSAISSYTDGNGRTLTTAYMDMTIPGSGAPWDTSDMAAVIQELVDSYSYASGAAMEMVSAGLGGSGWYQYSRTYNYDPTKAPKLRIEYTEAAGGNPFYAYAQQ